MRYWYVLMMIGLLIGSEMVRAYWGAESRKPGWFRWMNYGVALLLVVFLFVLSRQVIFALNTY